MQGGRYPSDSVVISDVPDMPVFSRIDTKEELFQRLTSGNMPSNDSREGAMTDASGSSQIRRFGAFELDPAVGELRKHGRKIKLQGQPVEILAMLLERRGAIITREEIRKKLWPANTTVELEHSVNAAVKRLRDALDDSAEIPRYVETLPKRGYRFIHPVETPNAIGPTPTQTQI